MKFSVESIEDNIARLESEGNEAAFISVTLLPEGVKEGDILLFDGEKYAVDTSATAVRRKAVYEKFDRLFRK